MQIRRGALAVCWHCVGSKEFCSGVPMLRGAVVMNFSCFCN